MRKGYVRRLEHRQALTPECSARLCRGGWACATSPAVRALWASRWAAAEYRGTSEVGLPDAAMRRGCSQGNGRSSQAEALACPPMPRPPSATRRSPRKSGRQGPSHHRRRRRSRPAPGRLRRPGECRLEQRAGWITRSKGGAYCSDHSCPNAMSSMSIATMTLLVSMRSAASRGWMRCRVGSVMPSTETKPSNRWAAGAPAMISTW
jgi:hypothetical protein